jgi:hypothetical protein
MLFTPNSTPSQTPAPSALPVLHAIGMDRVDDTDDDLYWRQSYRQQSFYREDTLFDDVKCRFGSDWDDVKGSSRLTWVEAQHAVRAAWERAAERAQRQAAA